MTRTLEPGNGPYCAKCGYSLDEVAGTIDHMFCGYGYMIQFHPECCPVEYDGQTCEAEHHNRLAMDRKGGCMRLYRVKGTRDGYVAQRKGWLFWHSFESGFESCYGGAWWPTKYDSVEDALGRIERESALYNERLARKETGVVWKKKL